MTQWKDFCTREMFVCLMLLGITGFLARPAAAQFSSGFVGTVVDQSGAAIPNAKVVITNQATNVETTTVSGSSGDFRVPALPGGTYNAVVEATAFRPWTQTNILLESNQMVTLYPALVVGAQRTAVEVGASAAAVETAQSDTSSQVDERTVEDAPLLGRNVYSNIIFMAPGITGSGQMSGGATISGSNGNDSFEVEPAFQINAAGQRQESNEYQVDGTSENSASRDGVVNLTPEADFIDAIRVSGANFTASKGRYSGALVQVFTKSGTNELHGSLSEFHEDNAITGRTIFQYCLPGTTGCHAVPAFIRNEFGGSLGGPLIKNKLFVYGGLFLLRSENGQTIVSTVETPAFDQWVSTNYPNGLATKFLSAAPPGSFPTTGILTAAQLEALTPGYYSVPASLPPDLLVVGTSYYNQNYPHNGYQWHVRGDYNPTEKDRIFLDWFDTYNNTHLTELSQLRAY